MKLNQILRGLNMLVLSFILLFGCSAKGGDVNYDTVVEFSKGVQLKFPDFILEYKGDRTVERDMPGGKSITFTHYDFEVSNGSVRKNISWSSGTGDIAPTAFEFEGKKYELELRNSEKLDKKLGENELVIVKK